MATRDRLIGNRTPGELVLLGVFLLVGVYMFLEAGNYSDTIGLYPRLLSGIVLVCTLLLLFQNVLPDRLRAYVVDSDGTIGSPDIPAEIDREDVDEGDPGTSGTAETSRGQVILTLLIGGYLLLSYLIGMYVATPLFVILYGVVYQLRWRMTLLLTVVSSVFAHLFLVVFDAPIASGILL